MPPREIRNVITVMSIEDPKSLMILCKKGPPSDPDEARYGHLLGKYLLLFYVFFNSVKKKQINISVN